MNFKSLFLLPHRQAQARLWAVVFNFFLIGLLLSLIGYSVFHTQVFDFSTIAQYKTVFFKGWLTTVWISLASLVLSSLIGLILALCRRSRWLFLRYFALVYIEFIRSTPLLVQILFFFYVIANAMNLDNRYVVGVITLSMFSGAYIAEMIRSGIDNISASQWDSAKAIGLSKLQTYRFIIFPQAFRQILPPLAGQFASLIKDSSLLSIIGINEFTHSAQQVNSATYSTLESFLPLALGYLILTLPISLYSRYLERKYHYEA